MAAEHLLEEAARALSEGDKRGAFARIQALLSTGDVAIPHAVQAVELLRAMGQEQAAEQVARVTAQGIEAGLVRFADRADFLADSGQSLLRLGRVDAGVAALGQALTLAPADPRPAYPLIGALLGQGRPERLRVVLRPVFEAMPAGAERDSLWQALALGLAHFGHQAAALDVIEQARPGWHGATEALDALAARIARSTEDDRPAAAVAEEFDAFAESYEAQLADIGNAGPRMIAEALDRIGLASAQALQVLDAGCGTGLCAEFLRPRAAHLAGLDVSRGMLEKARARKVYDMLAATDLGRAEGLPIGPFDLVVAADVFTYIGDLAPVLRNLAAVTREGGWLVFTVEDGDALDSPGPWQGTGTGRFRHRADYVAEALAAVGFRAPDLRLAQVLRREFGQPVPGLCLAARRAEGQPTMSIPAKK